MQTGRPSSMVNVQTEPQSKTSDGKSQLPTPPAPPSPESQKLEILYRSHSDVLLIQSHCLRRQRQESITQPYNKDDQYIRAFMSEIMSVFKDIAQLNPLFRRVADFVAAVSTGILIARSQRDNAIKGIKTELGMESDGKDKLIKKITERAAVLKIPEAVRKLFDEEIAKLANLEPAASEANVTTSTG
ncbi:hypothetical protein F5887DRAFT_915475 [Amanita rubescens]|nr:hypothetical protein F5887DRAFT_915475 [Amanita rubescens]